MFFMFDGIFNIGRYSGSICFPQLTVKISHIDLSNEKVGCGLSACCTFLFLIATMLQKMWLNIIRITEAFVFLIVLIETCTQSKS